MAILDSLADLDIKGRVLASTVPNSTGSIVTWNSSTNVFGTRSNAQIIADLGLQRSLTAGNHIDITSNTISVKPTLNTWIEDSGDNNRILMSTVSTGTNHNDMVLKQISSDGYFKLRNAQDDDFFVYKNNTQEVMLPLVGVSTATTSNIMMMGSTGTLWKSNRTIGDLIQNLSNGAGVGQIDISGGGTSVSLRDLGRVTMTDFDDVSNINGGFTPIYNTTGSVGFPTVTGQGILSLRSPTTLGSFALWKSNANDSNLYVNLGSSTGWQGWKSIATTDNIPTASDYITTNTNQTGLTGNKTSNADWTFGRAISSRLGFFGTYNPAQTQGIWGMREDYNVSASTTTLGNQYGLAYSYIDVGGSSVASEHQVHFVSNGLATVSIGLVSGLIRANGGFVKVGQNDTQMLLAGGGHRPVSDFALVSSLGNYVPYTGANQTVNLGTQDLTALGVIRKNKEIQHLSSMRVYHNVTSWAGSSSHTGFIRINTPIKNSVMFWLKVRIYEYSMRSFSEYIITGYWYLGAIGYNTRVTATTGNVYLDNVQLGVNGNGELVILMHSKHSNWSYPKVMIDEVGYTHAINSTGSDITDYSVSITTDDSDFTNNVTIPYNSFIRDSYYLDYNNFTNTPTIPTASDYITTNTNQTGLTGNKSVDGTWTFNSQINTANHGNSSQWRYEDYGLGRYVNAGVGSSPDTLGGNTGFYLSANAPTQLGSSTVKIINIGNSSASTIIGQIGLSHGNQNKMVFRTNTSMPFVEVLTEDNLNDSLRVRGNGIIIHNATSGDTNDIRNASRYSTGINRPSSGNGSVVNFTPYSSSGNHYGFDLYMAAASDRFFIRRETAAVKQNWIEVIHENNLDSQATALGFIKSSALPTVNNGQLTLSTGTGLSGSATFTANQAGNSSVTIDVASTHKLPTTAEWASALVNTTYTAGTGLSLTGTVFGQSITTSGSGTYVQSITQTASGFQVNLGTPPNTNTTYTGSNGINVTGTVISPTYGTTANTIAQGNDVRINNGQTAYSWGDYRQWGLGSSNYNQGWQYSDLDDLAIGGFKETSFIATNLSNPVGNKAGFTYPFGIHINATTNVRGDIIMSHGANRLAFRGAGRAFTEVITEDNLDSQATALGFIKSGSLGSYVPTSRTITINGVAQNLSANRTWTIPDTITRLRGTTSGTYASGDFTLIAGANTSITQSGTNITIASTNTNTTYSAGTGLTLSGTTFGQTITTSGSGTFVKGITQTANGFEVELSTPPNTTYSAGNGLTLSGTTFSLPITYSGTGNYVSAVTQTTNGLTVTRDTLPTVNNGTFQVQGTGSLTGSGSTSANASANTTATLDLTANEKSRIQQGVDAYAAIPALIDGVDYHHLNTGGHVQIERKKTIVNIPAGSLGYTINIDDAPYDGYELAINGCGEWSVTVNGSIMDKCGDTDSITLGWDQGGSALFWWSKDMEMWIQAI